MPTPGPTRSGLQVRQRSTSRGLALGLRIASSISVGLVIMIMIMIGNQCIFTKKIHLNRNPLLGHGCRGSHCVWSWRSGEPSSFLSQPMFLLSQSLGISFTGPFPKAYPHIIVSHVNWPFNDKSDFQLSSCTSPLLCRYSIPPVATLTWWAAIFSSAGLKLPTC